MNKKSVLIALALALAVFAAISGCAQEKVNNTQSSTQNTGAISEGVISERVDKAVEYVNSNLLRSSYTASLVNYTKYGDHLYRIYLDFSRNGTKVGTDSIFMTSDGDVLILNRNCIREINKTYSSDPVENAVEYINRDMVSKGISVELLNKSSYGEDLFKLRIKVLRNGTLLGNQELYVTKDGGKLIVGNCVVDMYNKYNRIRVSIDADDPYLGNKSAKVVIVEFSDFACPYCALFENKVLPRILDEYGDKILLVFKDFPVHGDTSMKAANAARCAGEQGKYWEYHRMLFQSQARWSKNESVFLQFANDLQLNLSEFKACMESQKYYGSIRKDQQEGMAAGVSGTPTIFVNGIKLVGVQPYERMSKIIEEELKKEK